MNNLDLLRLSLPLSLIIVAALVSADAATTNNNHSKYKQLILKRFARSSRNVPGYFRTSQISSRSQPRHLCYQYIRLRHASYHQKLECKKQRFPECVKHKNQVKKVKDNIRETLRTTVNVISHQSINQEAERRMTLEKIFRGFDTNNDNMISKAELENYLVLYNLIPPSFIPAQESSNKETVNS